MGDKSKPDQIMEDVQSIEDNEELIELIDSAEEESFDDESPLIELVLEAEPEEGTAAAEPEHENDEDEYDETVLIDDIVGEDIDEEALSSFEETILLDDIAGEDLISDEDVVDFDPETDEEAALSLEISPEEDEGDDIIDLDTDAIAAPRSDDEHPEIVKDHISDKENDDVIDLDADAIAGSREADEIFPLEEKDDDIIELDADTANTDHDVREDKEGQLEEFADTDAEIIIAPYGLEDAESVPKPEPDAEEKDFIDLEAESILASQEPDIEETIFLGDADYVSEPRKAEKKEDEFTDSDEETIIAPYGLEETVLMQDTVPKSGFEEKKDFIDLEAENILASQDFEETIFMGDAGHVSEISKADKKQDEFTDSDEETIIAPYGLDDSDSILKPDAEEKDFIDLEAESILASQEPDIEETIFLGDADYVPEISKADKKQDEFTDSNEETIIAPYDLDDSDSILKPDAEEKDFIDLEAESILASQEPDIEETIFLGDADYVPEPQKAEKKENEFTGSDEETIIAPYGLEETVLMQDTVPMSGFEEEKDFIDLEAESILASQEPDFEETIFLGDADYVPEISKAEKKENEFTDSDEETIIAPYGLEDNDGILKPDAEEENDIIDLEAANILASNDFEQSDFLRQAAAPKKLRDEDSLDGMEGAETIIMPHGLEDADSPEAVRPKPSTLKSASEPIDLQEYAEELLLTDDDIVDLPLETILSPEELDKINGSESDFSRVPEDDEIIDLGEDSIVEPPQSKSDEPSEDTPPFDIEEVFEPDDNATIIVSDYSEADAEIKGLMAEDSADDILPAEFLAGDTEGYQQQEKDLLELLEMDLDLKADQRAHLLFDEIQEAEQEAENEKESQKTDVPPKLTGDGDVGFQERQKLKKDAKTEKEEKTPLISDEIPLQDLEKEISSYPPEQLEAVLEQVIKRVFSEKAFSEKIEGKLIEVIERAVSKEIDRLKDVLFEDISDDDLLN